ncbi:TPA: hypothetical protein I7303_24195 [Vibrio parahaemolyticus]|nr:hypothetical protein [Vibrio parahaemolyticus]HAS6967099.1 hypothetical protein [Vibrio parahaemolyticus]
MSNVPEDKLIVHYDEEFKNKFIEAIESLYDKLEGFEFNYTVDELKESVIDDERFPIDSDSVAFVIDPAETCEIFCDAIWDWEDAMEVRQIDIISLLEDLSIAKLIGNVEYFTPTLYIHKVSVTTNSPDSYSKFFSLDTSVENITLEYSSDESFHFSYLVSKLGFKELVLFNSYVYIRGENLTLEHCRKVYKSYVFEANAVANVTIKSDPNIAYDMEDHLEEDDSDFEITELKRPLIICDDTDKVIELYNKAICCDDDEVTILFYCKVIEFISETVVREKVTTEARKVLLSNKALTPNANFVKELQELFKDHSYQKDADSLKLTVQTCGYFTDLELLTPEFIQQKVKTERKKGGNWAALGVIADSITAVRNKIAHAKSNYRLTGKEIPEEQYPQLSELLRVLAQQCIRWYSAQSPLARVK